MSFDRILATKEYGKFIIDKCNETESYKFSEYNSQSISGCHKLYLSPVRGDHDLSPLRPPWRGPS